MSKVNFTDWKGQLYAMAMKDGIEDFDYDLDLARNYYREGYSPREFYREVITSTGEDLPVGLGTDSFDPLLDL